MPSLKVVVRVCGGCGGAYGRGLGGRETWSGRGDLEPGSGSGRAHNRGVRALGEGELRVVEVWRLF